MKASHNVLNRLLTVLALALVCSSVAAAGGGSTDCWTLRGVVARMDTDNRLFLDLGGERRASFLNAGSGLGLSYEYRRGCRWGFEAGLLTAELNSLFIFDSVAPAFWGEGRDGIGFTALTLGPTFHLTPGRRADVYVGPLFALTDFSAGNYRPLNMLDVGPPAGPVFRQEFDADPAWGFQAGLDLPLRRGSPWALHVGAKYLDLEVDTGAALAGTLDVNPTIWTAGISYSPGGCRDCQTVDECTGLLRRLDELDDCRVCPSGQECRPEDPCEDCEDCEGPECLESTGRECKDLCPPCPDGQRCHIDPLTCDDFPEECRDPKDPKPACDPGEECRQSCPPAPTCRELGCPDGPFCPAGLECRPGWSCEDCQDPECLECPGQACPDLCPPRCEECDLPPPIPPCPDGQACRGAPLDCAEFPAECRQPCPPTSWGLCCLILTGLVALWLIWWVFHRQRLPIRWFWLWMVPLVFLIGKLWFLKSALCEAWLLWWLLAALVLTLLFAVLRLLVRKRWIGLLLAGLGVLALLALGPLAAWSWLWWFLAVALVLLLVGLIWRSARDDRHGLVRMILLAILILVLILLGPLAAWVWSWRLLLAVLALLLLHWMAHWLRHRDGSGGRDGGAWLAMVALLGVVIYAGAEAAAGWLWWFLAILAAAVLIYILRHWIGDRRNTWLVLLAVLILVLLLLGRLAAWSWLWWFLLVGLVVLLLCLLWRRLAGRRGPEPRGLWLIAIVVMVLVLLLLGGAAGYGWLWWFLLLALLLPILWLLWRLLGASLQAACAVLGLPLVLLLVFLGIPAAWTWLGWLLLVAAALLLLYVLLRYLGWAPDAEHRLRLWLCLLILLILALFCLGPLADGSGHWWLALLALVLVLAGVAWRLIGGAAGLGQLVWLGLLLIAIVLLILLSAGGEPACLAALLLCTLLALLPLAIWALWSHTAGGGSPIGMACAGGLVPLRQLQQGLGPIDKADPAAVRELFLAYRDRRGWSDMYTLFDAMPDELQEDLEIRQQLAFALNRDGRDGEAEKILTALESDDARRAESWGLLGRIYKDRWDAARKLATTTPAAGDSLGGAADGLLDRAIQTYLAGHDAGDRRNPYPGINALTLAEFTDGWQQQLADRLPGELDAALDAAEPADTADYWHHATRLELAIHGGQEAAARQALARALAAARPSPNACPQVWKVETTCRNLRLLEEGRRRRDEALPGWAAEVIEELEGAGNGGPGPGDDPGTTLARFLDLRDRQAWPQMYALIESMPPALGASAQVRQQHAFALNRDGRDEEAAAILVALRDEDGPSAETCGLLGRIHKDRWDAARRADDAEAAGHLDRAIQAYLEGHDTGEGNPYPGINALTLVEFDDARRRELRRRLLRELDELLGSGGGSGDYWHHATRLELAVHRELESEGRAALSRAVEALADAGQAAVWMRQTTCRNLRLIEEAQRQRGEEPAAWLGEAIAALERG